jgi:hypothetical protein
VVQICTQLNQQRHRATVDLFNTRHVEIETVAFVKRTHLAQHRIPQFGAIVEVNRALDLQSRVLISPLHCSDREPKGATRLGE